MKLIKFILNNRVLKTDERNLTIQQIESTKQLLSNDCNCKPDDIEVIVEEKFFSDYDVCEMGIFKWDEPFPKCVKGVGLAFKEGSDEHLDSISKGTLEKHLIFI
jgi:hypothetical protein